MTPGPVLLTVEGEEVRLIDTVRLFQRRPFPGGHRYTLTIADPVASLSIVPTSAPSTAEQQTALWAMTDLLLPSRENLSCPPATS